LDTTVDALAIDGTVFRAPAGGLYFLWSGRPEAASNAQHLYIAPMSNPWTVSAPRSPLARPEHDWERVPLPGAAPGSEIAEAPAVLQRDGKVFVTYSVNNCASPDYALGMLTLTEGADPLEASSWTKSPTPVLSRSDADWVFGPGHNGFFTSPDGTETWVVYHALSHPKGTPTGACDNSRSARVQRVGTAPDGSPVLREPAATWRVLDLPAGDPGPRPVAAGRYRISTAVNGHSLDGCGKVEVAPRGADACQVWEISARDDGTYAIIRTGGALTVRACSTANGAEVVVRSDDTCQGWYLDAVGDGGYRVSAAVSGKALEVTGCPTRAGAAVDVWPFWGAAGGCQLWTLERAR
jgi:hypothetical protein